MLATTGQTIGVLGIDIGKNSCHVVGVDDRGAIVRRSVRLQNVKFNSYASRKVAAGPTVRVRRHEF
jgi:hypothetical protein